VVFGRLLKLSMSAFKSAGLLVPRASVYFFKSPWAVSRSVSAFALSLVKEVI